MYLEFMYFKNISFAVELLKSVEGEEDKLMAVCSRYAVLLEQNRLVQKTVKETQKLYSAVRSIG